MVHEQEHVEVEDCQRFGVTTQTIRRDINKLCEQGLLRRRYGGVSLPSSAVAQADEARAQPMGQTADG
jgi:DeoR family glycerol-3-phosphate regulon repressor